MRFTKLFLVVICFMVCSVSSGQDSGDILNSPAGGGTRAFSMGGVYTATNVGIAALYGNPGGLALYDNAQFLVDAKTILLGSAGLEKDYFTNVHNYTDYEQKFKIYPKLMNFGLSVPITLSNYSHKLVGAVGYRSFYDSSVKEFEKRQTDSGSGEMTTTTRGILNTLSFGLGTLISDKYSFGFSINIPVLTGYEYEEDAKGEGVTYSSKEEWDISGGTILQFGGIIKANEKLSVGVSYITSHKIKTEDGKWEENDNGDQSNGTYSDEDKYTIPGLYSLGIAYQMNPEMLVSAEVQNRPWEDYEIDGTELSALENGRSYRFGLEYGKDFLVRAGFMLERLPVMDTDRDPVNMKALTAGISYNASKFIVDFGAVYWFATFDAAKYSDRVYEYSGKQLLLMARITKSLDWKIGN